MGRGKDLLGRLADESGLSGQPLPGQPIIEVAGDRRVLVENHMGVKEYGRNRILVKVKFGCVCVCGSCLEMMRMTREQLVISGKIDGITLLRRS